MSHFVWVIPCYNEAERLPAEQLTALLERPGTRLLLVDDGSTDATWPLLQKLAEHPDIEALQLPHNMGKAEAVRAGLLHAQAQGAWAVGFLDADMATPVDEALRLLEVLEDSEYSVVMGARILRMGAAIERQAVRHYLGRVFATAASMALGIPVYDTQCGAKLFRDTPAIQAALSEPFRSRWAFDVELLQRMLHAGLTTRDIVEVPLLEWRDVRGSKVTKAAFVRAGLDLMGLAWRSRARKV